MVVGTAPVGDDSPVKAPLLAQEQPDPLTPKAFRTLMGTLEQRWFYRLSPANNKVFAIPQPDGSTHYITLRVTHILGESASEVGLAEDMTTTVLEQQRIDIGLVVEQKSSRNMNFIPVMDIEDIFVATPSYLENLRLREGADTDVFQSGNLMLLDKNNITRHYIDDYMAVNEIISNNLLEVTTMDLLIEFARIGLGIGCVIKEFVKEDLDSGRLTQLKLDTPIHKRTVGFLWQSSRTSKALDTFIRFCKEQDNQNLYFL